MILIRKGRDRGHADHGWLDTWHTFSFADYVDPAQMGYSSLRVINDDLIAPGAGFPTHAHRNMEIITYILEGALRHKDSMGNGSMIRRGDVQRMSAGKGVSHSEFNASDSEPVHLLQIWILPAEEGITPGYEQKNFSDQLTTGFRLIASPDGRDDSVTICQDARLFAARIDPKNAVSHTLAQGRCAYLHLASGEARLNGQPLAAGDGARIENEAVIRLESDGAAEALLFDLPGGDTLK